MHLDLFLFVFFSLSLFTFFCNIFIFIHLFWVNYLCYVITCYHGIYSYRWWLCKNEIDERHHRFSTNTHVKHYQLFFALFLSLLLFILMMIIIYSKSYLNFCIHYAIYKISNLFSYFFLFN